MLQINISTRQTILSKELRNPDSSFLMEIHRNKVKPCRAPSKNKRNIFVYFYRHFFWENKHFENYTHFIYLIKGIVLGRALWGC